MWKIIVAAGPFDNQDPTMKIHLSHARTVAENRFPVEKNQ
jgi:hypothetical protein